MSNKYTTPIEESYKEKIEGVIKIKHNDVNINVCKITYETFYNGDYQYIFEPYYSILDALPSSFSEGIPGIDLDKRKQYYYRVNMIPSFISERTIDKDREDLKEELEKISMGEYNPLEWLIRTDTEYSGDNLIVERYRLPQELKEINCLSMMKGDLLKDESLLSSNVDELAKQLFALVGSGVDINTQHIQVDDANRTSILKLLIHMFKTYYSVKDSINKKEDVTGVQVIKNKKKKIDDFLMEEVIKELELKIISEREAMNMLNINTRSTLLRKIREYKLEKRK